MKRASKFVSALAIAGSLLGGTAAAAEAHATKGSLPARTSRDVQVLATKEQAVLSRLEAFSKLKKNQTVSSWETQLKKAEAAQTAAADALTKDLAPKAPPAPAPHSGSTLSFKDESGNPYTVTLGDVIDPAQGSDQFTTPNAGYRFVATVFRITDTGSGTISDDANSDASVVGSNDQTYTADFDNVSECTNFNSGEYQLVHGQSATGCVVFQIPTGVKVKTVEWSPSGGFGGNFGEWNIIS